MYHMWISVAATVTDWARFSHRERTIIIDDIDSAIDRIRTAKYRNLKPLFPGHFSDSLTKKNLFPPNTKTKFKQNRGISNLDNALKSKFRN